MLMSIVFALSSLCCCVLATAKKPENRHLSTFTPAQMAIGTPFVLLVIPFYAFAIPMAILAHRATNNADEAMELVRPFAGFSGAVVSLFVCLWFLGVV